MIIKRNYLIDFLRLIFCLVIINYHFFSHFLLDISDPPYFFSRGYMGDEFFFIIAGFYLQKAAVTDNSLSPYLWNINQLWERLKNIAIPYYITWMICFLGVRFTNSHMGTANRPVFLDLADSIYELFFLEMFGFIRGFYSNQVGWFFSALLISTFLIGPIAKCFKKTFSFYIAPVIALFSYGMLYLNYNFLWNPYSIIGSTFFMKGTIRALAAVCVGCIIHGISSSRFFEEKCNHLSNTMKRGIVIGDIFLWILVVAYMVYPFSSRSGDGVYYDYAVIMLMTIALIPVLGNLYANESNDVLSKVAKVVGKYSFYAYFGQAIFYSFDKLITTMDISKVEKAVIHNTSIFIISIMLALLTKTINKMFYHINSAS